MGAVAATAQRARKQRARRLDPESRFAPLEAKLLAPTARPGLVKRKALVDQLRATSMPVVCINAPAGYGKTTLVAQWGSADNRPFAWVSLDRSDNDPVEFITCVALTLNRVEPLGGAVFDALSVRAPDVDASVLPHLGKALAAATRPRVLVLDDIHMLVSEQSLDAVAVLIRHIPPGSQIVLVSRSEPTLPLGRLRAEGALLELGAPDLALRARGADALLRAAGVRLDPKGLRLITERTEGWPAGLYLAALALKAEGTVVTPVEGFAGDDKFVADYFGEQVLSRLSLGVARFLTQTSVLDRLSGELCDAILDSSGSAAKLTKLEQSNFFLIPLDRRRIWYRYHTLFAEMLRRRLHDEDPELELELHRRAAAWYAGHGDPGEAIHHALQAGDISFAGDVVWGHANSYLGRGRAATLAKWLDSFTDDAIASHPPLALAAAWLALVGGDTETAERWTSTAAAGSFTGPLSDGAASLDSAVTLLRAMLAREGVTRMGKDAAVVRRLESERSAWRASACFLEGVSLRLQGELGPARSRLQEGHWLAASLGVVKVDALCLVELALLAAAEEDWSPAGALIAQAKALLEDHGLTEESAMASVLAASTLVLAHRGEAEEAQRELQKTRRVLARGKTYPWVAVEARLILARASLLLADPAGARTLLSEARRQMRTAPSDLGTLADTLTELTAQAESFPAARVVGPSALTTAEIRLLHFLPTHLSFREIGERMHLSRNTVKTQAISIYRKLQVSKRGEAVQRARDLGFIDA